MKELDKLVENYFTKKKAPELGMDMLLEMVEQSLEEMATIRSNRVFYYVAFAKTPKEIQTQLRAKYPEIENFEDRIFVKQELNGTDAIFSFFLAKEQVTRNDVYDANKREREVESMKGAEFIMSQTRAVKLEQTKVTWLQVKPEELRAENEELERIKVKFQEAGISNETPAEITIKGAKLSNVAKIDKMTSKTAVGDFGLFDSEGQLLFSISHKALGFERYAALVSALKTLDDDDKFAADAFVTVAGERWKEGALQGKRSTKGFYDIVDSPSLATQLTHLIYGVTTNKADALFIGNIDLERKNNNSFELSVKPQKTSVGSSAVYLGGVPVDEQYAPIFKSRFGSGGSKIHFNSAEIQDINEKLAEGVLTLEKLDELGIKYELQTDMIGVEEPLVESVFVPVRFYISPQRRTDGAERITQSDYYKYINIDYEDK